MSDLYNRQHLLRRCNRLLAVVSTSCKEQFKITDGLLEVEGGKIQSYFAKYGDPNGEGLPVWPEFTNISVGVVL